MKTRNFFLMLILIFGLLTACAPKPAATPESQPAAVDSAPLAVSTAPAQESAPLAVSTEPAQESAPEAVPTSRGDQLQATDPATVALASGGLQLVEIFRFT